MIMIIRKQGSEKIVISQGHAASKCQSKTTGKVREEPVSREMRYSERPMGSCAFLDNETRSQWRSKLPWEPYQVTDFIL